MTRGQDQGTRDDDTQFPKARSPISLAKMASSGFGGKKKKNSKIKVKRD